MSYKAELRGVTTHFGAVRLRSDTINTIDLIHKFSIPTSFVLTGGVLKRP